jgi:hypothetical protein
LKETAFHHNPFLVLGATVRDNRHRIVELAELKALELDHDICQKARLDLINPRSRLAAEMAWLPGVSEARADRLIRLISEDPQAIRSESGIPALAHANLMAAAFESVAEYYSESDAADFILRIAERAQSLDPEEILRDINEDRFISGFPEIKNREPVEAELSERRKYYRSAIMKALNDMPPAVLVEAVPQAVVDGSHGDAFLGLIDEVVDAYEVEAQFFLQKEAENVSKLVKAVRQLAGKGELIVEPLIHRIDEIVVNWERVAFPIRLRKVGRGLDHPETIAMVSEIRGLALELYNDHDMIFQSSHITYFLRAYFDRLPVLAERLEEDSFAIENILHKTGRTEAPEEAWVRENTCQVRTEDGPLCISPWEIDWQGRSYPLESITGVAWGRGRKRHQLLPAETAYVIAFCNTDAQAVIWLREKRHYSNVVDILWRTVCVRLMIQMAAAIQRGETIRRGDALVDDDGVTLSDGIFPGRKKTRHYGWKEIRVWSDGRKFHISAADDKRRHAAFSYVDIWNVHMLEHLIRKVLEKGLRKLSELGF